MTQFAAVSKLACSTAFALFLASACGGNSFSSTDEPQGGTESGGSNAGGSVIQAGKHQGGSVSGGTRNTAGTASGGGPTAGAGGSSPGGEACNAPPVSGNCDAYFQVWFHDPATGLCRPFIYGGCGGNENNYPSFEACQEACPGGSPNYDACSVPTDCMITGGGCCGICDGPDIGERDLVAYNKKYAGQLQQCAFAAEGAAPPGDIACAPCPPLAGDTGSLKYFVPNCVQGQCVVEDIRTSSVSACKTDQECFIRNGNGCCESCGTKQSIAVSSNGGFNQLVCGELQPPCAACVVAPSNETAVCGQSGHCEVEPTIAQ
jgi:hypothetical protein